MKNTLWNARVLMPIAGVAILLGAWAAFRPAPAASRESPFASAQQLEDLVLAIPGPDDPRPRAVVDAPEHDFGAMDLGQTGEHRFVIRNEGEAPLKLHKGPTTCRCTLSNLVDDAIPPNGQGEVALTWEPRVGGDDVRQSATIFTNDPENRELKLVVTGKVLAFAAVTPSPLLFPEVQPGQSATRRALIFSQAWDHFEIAGIDSAGPDMSWEVTPAPQAIVEKIDAKAAYVIEVTVPAGLPAGDFGGQLAVRVAFPRHPEAGDVRTLRLDVVGKVAGSVAIYHPRIRNGQFDLGQWREGETFKERFPVYLRGEHVDAQIVELRAEPDFVVLRHVQGDRLSDQLAVHTLELEVPGTALPSWYTGRLVVVTDHPTNPEVLMPLRFVVTAGAALGTETSAKGLNRP
jgi:hypothetical protein